MRIPFQKGAIAIALLAGLTAGAQHRYEFSVQQAVDYARKNNVQVKNALVDVQIQQQTNREITASAFPQINGNLGAGFNPNVAVQQFPNFIAAATYGVLQDEGVKNGSGQAIVSPGDFGFIQAQFGSKFNANYGLNLQQLLFDGQVFVGLQARKTSIDFRNKAVEVTEENIKANIEKIYYQLSASKEQIRLIDVNLALLRTQQHDQQLMFENGFVDKLSVTEIGVRLANAETDRQRALNNIANGFVGLKFLMGMPIADTLVLTDSVTYESVKDGVLENVAYQYADRKEYQYAELGRKLSEFNIKRYKLSYLPTVSLSSSYSRLSQSNKFNFFGGAKWFPASSVGLNIAVPIFDGFRKAAQVQNARLQLEQAQNNIENLKLSIDQDVATALNNYRSALAALDVQKRNIDLAQEVYNQTKKAQEQGMRTLTDVSVAQTNLQAAQNNYILSLYDALNAKVDFLKATGKL